ncbi:MAG: hypothetical protein ACRBFS_13770 [Aureispira sp.]
MHLSTFNRLWAYSCSLLLVLLLCNCSREEPLPLNEVTSKDDVAIGNSIDAAYMYHIDTLPDEQLLTEEDHPGIYRYLHRMCAKVQATTTQSMQINEDRPLRKPTIRVLECSGKKRAFVAPGGHLYLYTDFLKTLHQEAELIPILAHLLNCSMYRFDIKKLESHFSTNFLLDLAIGSNVGASYASPATNVSAVIEHLATKPYLEKDVAFLDELAERITCELGYDIQVYSTFFMNNSNQDLDWFELFPRNAPHSTYAAHLFNTVSDSLTCGGTISTAGYPNFKTLIP